MQNNEKKLEVKTIEYFGETKKILAWDWSF
jgi:hypothetical protein